MWGKVRRAEEDAENERNIGWKDIQIPVGIQGKIDHLKVTKKLGVIPTSSRLHMIYCLPQGGLISISRSVNKHTQTNLSVSISTLD